MARQCDATPPCVNPRTHKPEWHRKASDCPKSPDYRPPTAVPPTPATAVETKPTPTAPVAPPTKKPGVGRLGWTAATSETEDAGESKELSAAEPKPVAEWLVDGPHTIELFKIIFGGIGRVTYVAADYLEVAEPPADLFVFPKKFAEAEIQADPKNYYSKAATWICQNLFRSKTQDEAHRTISTIGFGAGMIGMFAGIGAWYYKAFKTSPKLQRNREKSKARREAERAAKLAQQKESNDQPTQTVSG